MELETQKTDSEILSQVIEEGKEVESQSIEDMAAGLFQQLLPQFEMRLGSLSKKGLQRVLLQLIKYPLVDIHFKMDKLESEVAATAQALLDSKVIMVASVMNERFKEAEQTEGQVNG